MVTFIGAQIWANPFSLWWDEHRTPFSLLYAAPIIIDAMIAPTLYSQSQARELYTFEEISVEKSGSD